MINVTKAGGIIKPFDREKLAISLKKVGATEDIINAIIAEIEPQLYEGISTKKIFRNVFALLRKKSKRLSGKYNLKQALYHLGPDGFLFEQFVGKLFESQGFEVTTGVILPGKCIAHEIDVFARSNGNIHLMECKFHNRQGVICHVQVPLYFLSRFYDVKKVMQQKEKGAVFHAWIITNTRFSEDSMAFANCSNIKLVGWDYPRKGSLRDRVNLSGIYPISCLSSLKKKEMRLLFEQNVIVCQDILKNKHKLKKAGIDATDSKKIIEEINNLIEP